MATQQQGKGDKARTKVTTPMFRVSFPSVFEASSYDGGPETFSVTALFDKAAQGTQQFKDMKRIAHEAIVKKYGADKSKWPRGLRADPFRPGSDKDHLDGYNEPGVVFARLSSRSKPGVVDASRQPIIDRDDFYAGCYARATITAFVYDQRGNKGVSFGLQNLQKLKDGESFSGRVAAEEEEGFADGDSSSNDDGDPFE